MAVGGEDASPIAADPLPDSIPLQPFAAPVLQTSESPDDEPPRDPGDSAAYVRSRFTTPVLREKQNAGVREVAERLQVCTATVYKLCANGALEHVRIVTSIRVTEAALHAFVASARSTHPTRLPTKA